MPPFSYVRDPDCKYFRYQMFKLFEDKEEIFRCACRPRTWKVPCFSKLIVEGLEIHPYLIDKLPHSIVKNLPAHLRFDNRSVTLGPKYARKWALKENTKYPLQIEYFNEELCKWRTPEGSGFDLDGSSVSTEEDDGPEQPYDAQTLKKVKIPITNGNLKLFLDMNEETLADENSDEEYEPDDEEDSCSNSSNSSNSVQSESENENENKSSESEDEGCESELYDPADSVMTPEPISEMYSVQRLLAYKILNNERLYLVEWSPSSDGTVYEPSWEPEDHILDPLLFSNFWASFEGQLFVSSEVSASKKRKLGKLLKTSVQNQAAPKKKRRN